MECREALAVDVAIARVILVLRGFSDELLLILVADLFFVTLGLDFVIAFGF